MTFSIHDFLDSQSEQYYLSLPRKPSWVLMRLAAGVACDEVERIYGIVLLGHVYCLIYFERPT